MPDVRFQIDSQAEERGENAMAAMTDARLRELSGLHRQGLLEQCLPFWMTHAIDHEQGGFFNYLDRDGSVYSTDKPVWVLSRFTWLMALLYNEVEKRPEWLEAAQHGIDFLEKYAFDDDGRMFYELTRDGRPLRKRRYLFTETFGVIAFSEYARATNDERRLAQAKELYELVLRYYRTPGLLPPKTYVTTRPAKAHAMPMILLATTQQLRKHGNTPLYDEVIGQSLREVIEDFMHEDERALLETVGPMGERLEGPEGRCINPGHAIETSWFILEEARKAGRPDLIDKACRILDWSLERGWDNEYGGILYFVDVEGKPCVQYEHDMKLWWPHCEALYATLLAYHMTGKAAYAAWHEKIHEWTFSRFPDRDGGEWFKYLHRDGSLSVSLKGNGWAGPFHVPRMHLNAWRLADEMLAASEGQGTGKGKGRAIS